MLRSPSLCRVEARVGLTVEDVCAAMGGNLPWMLRIPVASDDDRVEGLVGPFEVLTKECPRGMSRSDRDLWWRRFLRAESAADVSLLTMNLVTSDDASLVCSFLGGAFVDQPVAIGRRWPPLLGNDDKGTSCDGMRVVVSDALRLSLESNHEGVLWDDLFRHRYGADPPVLEVFSKRRATRHPTLPWQRSK